MKSTIKWVSLGNSMYVPIAVRESRISSCVLKFTWTIVLQRCAGRIQQKHEGREAPVQSEEAIGDLGSPRLRVRGKGGDARIRCAKKAFRVGDDHRETMLVLCISKNYPRRPGLPRQLFNRHWVRQRVRDALFSENRREEESTRQRDPVTVEENRAEEVRWSLCRETEQSGKIPFDWTDS